MNEIIEITGSDVVAVFDRKEGVFSFICTEEKHSSSPSVSVEIVRDRVASKWMIQDKPFTFNIMNGEGMRKFNRVVKAANDAVLRLNDAQMTPSELVKTSGPLANALGSLGDIFKGLF